MLKALFYALLYFLKYFIYLCYALKAYYKACKYFFNH